MSSYFSQFFKKLRCLFSSSDPNEIIETTPEKSCVKRKYCEIGVGTGEDLEETTNPPVKKVTIEMVPPPPEIPPVSSTIEMRRKCCTNFGDLVEFGDAFGLAPPTLISGQTTTDPTIPTTSATTTTATTPTTTSATTTTSTTTVPPKATTPPKDDKTTPTDSTAKKDDEKTAKEKKEDEEFIKTHEVHVVDPPPESTEIPPSTNTDAKENPTPPAPPPQPLTPPPPPVNFSSPHLQNFDFNEQIDFLRKNIINPMKCRDLYKSANISLPKGIYFYGLEIKSHALVLVKALATELGKEFGEEKKPLRIFRRMASDVVSKYSTDKSGYSFVDRLFSVATKNKPSIVFIEDLDKFGGYCQYNIMTNHDLVTKLGTCMDALIPGEVFVIATIAAMGNTFAPLNSGKRFTKFLEFPSKLSPKGILGCLKMETEKWKISSETTAENSRNEILTKVSDLLSTCGLSLKCDDITTLCQEIYQTAINDQIQGSRPPAADCCSCCKCPPTAPEFPTVPQWEAGIKAFTKLKKSTATATAKDSDFTAATAHSDSSMDSLSFSKIGGLAGQIQILTENIITPLKNRDKLKELGWDVEPVRGFIFHGPPGTGKTLLGKTLAAELSRVEEGGKGKKFSFFYHKGTDCYTKWVGDTEAKLRSIFANAEAKKPAIIFMDEIDGLCSAREESASISKFYNGVVTTMLGLMDNLPRGEVFVIAATNRLTCLDPALRRPGRFDKSIEFQAPKLEGRKSILEIHTATWDAKSKMETNFVDEIAQMTGGYTGADLEQVCRQAFVFAMRRHSASQNPPEENVKESDFGGLIVQRQDWFSALKSVRPSGTNHFGNAVITDKPIPSGAAAALKDKLDEITGRLGYFLKPDDGTDVVGASSSKCGGGLNTFLIWGSDAKQLKVIDNLLIPALFSSPGFSTTLAAKFEIPPLGVGQEVIQRHISSTFNHVLNPGEGKLGVLYIPGIDQLLNARIGKFWKMKEHEQILDSFEMLRGERVLLIGTATGSPDQMSDRVQVLFRGLQNSRHYELSGPNVPEIRQVFANISGKIPPATFEKIITKLGGSTPPNTADRVPNTAASRKNLSLYDLLDFEGEVTQIFTQFDMKPGKDKTDDEISTALEKATEAFCSYLDGQEKYKSSLSSMYT